MVVDSSPHPGDPVAVRGTAERRTADGGRTSRSVQLAVPVRTCTGPFTLVLDDVHLLSDVSSTDLIASLAANVPAGSMVVLIRRWCLLDDQRWS